MTTKKTVYWVTFYSPGAFVADTQNKDCDGLPDPADVVFPDHAYAFEIYQQDIIVDGDKTFKAKPEQVGPMYYHPDSMVTTLEEARNDPNSTNILISNMTINKWPAVIWTRWHTWPQPYDPEKAHIL